ncbi:TDP-N-acetylfucosamine:lipid II N-acetylfucosaminyltransferase [Thomasclavelia spiroformis]
MFDLNNYIFVTPYKSVYDEIFKFYKNIIFLDKKNIFKTYLNYNNIIILHSITFSKLRIIFTRKSALKHCILRTWGHDINRSQNTLKSRIGNYFYSKKLKYFLAIGCSNLVDMINVKQYVSKEMKTIHLSYTYLSKNQFNYLCEIKSKYNPNNTKYRVIIGHSGDKADNHKAIIDDLLKFTNRDIEFIFLLSYGDKNYCNELKEYIYLTLRDNATIIEHFMSLNEYVKLIKSVDVIILDSPFSSSLGMLSYAIFFERKIYVNRNGIIGKAIKECNAEINYTDELSTITYNEFIKPKFDKKLMVLHNIRPVEEIAQGWKKIENL